MTSTDAASDTTTGATSNTPGDAPSKMSTIKSGERLDELAQLEEERRFLLKSLKDLEREYEAGDVDDVDYTTLKDGYTARAAGVLRDIEAGRSQLAPKPPRQWGKMLAIGVAMALGVAGVGLALASAFGEREAGQELTGGDVRPQINELLVSARAALGDGAFGRANELFAQVDERERDAGRDNPEARAYVGWTFALLARAREETPATAERYELSVLLLDQAIAMDPTYADPHCFAAIIEHSFLNNSAEALGYIETCEAMDPPSDIKGLIDGFAAEIRAAA